MRWEEMSWDEVRRAQMRWRVQCEVARRVQCEVWSVKCEVWSVKCEVWSVECEVWSLECEECSVKCEVWSAKSAVSSVKCGVWSAKWSFKCDMWSRTQLSQSARAHGLGWRTAHASSIDEKGLIYIFKATSAPPRAGTTGILYIIILYYILYIYILCVYIYINNIYIQTDHDIECLNLFEPIPKHPILHWMDIWLVCSHSSVDLRGLHLDSDIFMKFIDSGCDGHQPWLADWHADMNSERDICHTCIYL